MSAKDPTNITIPSVFVSEFTGSYLRDVYSYNEGYFVIINDQPLNINTHLLLPFAIVVGICFLVMFTFMVRMHAFFSYRLRIFNDFGIFLIILRRLFYFSLFHFIFLSLSIYLNNLKHILTGIKHIFLLNYLSTFQLYGNFAVAMRCYSLKVKENF